MATDAKMASQRTDAMRPMMLQGSGDEKQNALVKVSFRNTYDLLVSDCLRLLVCSTIYGFAKCGHPSAHTVKAMPDKTVSVNGNTCHTWIVSVNGRGYKQRTSYIHYSETGKTRPRRPINSRYSRQNRLRIEQCSIQDGFCRRLADTVFR